MKNLLEFLLLHIVEHPDEIQISETEEMGNTVYNVKVHEDDMGRVIGTHGSHINNIRRISQILASIRNDQVRVNLEEPIQE